MIFGFLYFVVIIAWLACFTAFMNSKKGDEKYWNVYDWAEDDWKIDYVFAAVFGSIFWPISIPGYLLFKFVYKQAEKFFK